MAEGRPEDYGLDEESLKLAEDVVRVARESGHPEECPDVETALRMLYEAIAEQAEDYMNEPDSDARTDRARRAKENRDALESAFLQIMERDHGLAGETIKEIASGLTEKGITLGTDYCHKGRLYVYRHGKPLFRLRVRRGERALKRNSPVVVEQIMARGPDWL